MDIDHINHVGMAVRDLAAAAQRHEAMGFQLTPYSPHSAAWKPGEPVKPLGSGNRCIMFAADYLEILASEHPGRPAPRITTFLDRHQGAHIICFESEDCEAVDARVRASGIETSGVIPLQREIDTPDGERTAKFQRVQFAPQQSPEGYIQAARHLTPQYIYQPRYTAHPNGCTALVETILVVLDLGPMIERYTRYVGFAPVLEEGRAVFRFARGAVLTIVEAARASTLLPGTLLPPLPGIAAVSFRAPDLVGQRKRLTQNGFTTIDVEGRILVPAEECCGVAMLFGM